ncbi:MAG: transglutaminaseTgpA domain-containing protein, partial [Vulcanococcus sp.]
MTSARRLHQLAIGLLSLQLLLSAGQHPLVWGGALLVLLAALKLRESRSRADLQRVALTEWVAVGLLAVLRPELAASLLQGLTALVVLAALLLQEGGGQRSLRQTLQRSLQLSLAALPLLVLLFLLLPRIGPLWSVAGGAAGRTGLDSILDPGAISRLVQDPTPALRVSWIQGAPPPQSQLYWRVLVLDRFDGRRWSRGPLPVPPARRPDGATGLVPEQLWVAEPSPLPALPWAGEGRPSDPALAVSSDGVLVGPAAGGRRRHYGITISGGDLPWRAVQPQPGDLALPTGSNPRLEALGASWQGLPEGQRLKAAQALFVRQQLRYTLSPPPLPQQAPLDELLFTTRAGFCEHFASAFTALMRAAGLPARVVVGYQGGEWIPPTALGAGYLEVRQSDAHAWSEVWLQGQGWVRVDPTAWVAPERISAG